MKIEIENIGPIKKAKINIDKLTVIAGENASGKTTIGKMLYAQVKSYGNVAKTTAKLFVNEAINERVNELLDAKKLDKNGISDINDIDVLLKFFKNKLDKEEYKNLQGSFSEYLGFLKTTEGFKKLQEKLLHLYVLSEFDGEPSSYDKNNTKLTITEHSSSNSNNVLFMSQSNDFIDFTSKVKLSPNKIFINESEADSVLSNIKSNIILTHQEDFIRFIRIKEKPINPVLEETNYKKIYAELNRIKDELRTLINGDFIYNENKSSFYYTINGSEIPTNNTANGVKTIGYFSQILRLDFLMGNHLLILDEPETSLHPAWQVKLAKTLVELVKIFNIKMVVISHSPYFIEAIHQSTIKYGIKDKTNAYLLELCKEDNRGYHIDANNDYAFKEIYKKLATGYTEIDKIVST